MNEQNKLMENLDEKYSFWLCVGYGFIQYKIQLGVGCDRCSLMESHIK